MTLSPTLPTRLAVTFLTSSLALTGCAMTGTAELPAPRLGAPAAPNVASVPMPLADLFDFPEAALTSRASLVGVDAGATCFDVLIRRPMMLPNDHGALPLQVSVDVDGAEASRREQTLPVCAPNAACLPPDSALLGFTEEDDARVRVEGQRVCFEGLPRARRELVLSANPGKGAWRFRFRLTGGQE